MRDIWDDILAWEAAGRTFALARVTRTWGSSPRPVGAAMIVGPGMEVAGSVSGGCIEGDVIAQAQAVLADGQPRRLHYGVSDETAWSVGLTCGGQVSVLVERHPAQAEGDDVAVWAALRQRLEGNLPAVLLTRLEPEPASAGTSAAETAATEADGMPAVGTLTTETAATCGPATASEVAGTTHLLVDPETGRAVAGDWRQATAAALAPSLAAWADRSSTIVEVAGAPVFAHVLPRQDRLLVIGASHICIPLVRLARVLDLETVVIDPRAVFARPERFPEQPARLERSWPAAFFAGWPVDEGTYAVVLTHDPKIDDEALHHLLRSPAAYIGALGSRRSHAARVERLRQAGFSDARIGRIRGPVGLDIRAESAEEIALSILAEVVAVRRGAP